MWFIYLAGAIACGIAVCATVAPWRNRYELLAGGTTVGLLGGGWITFVLALVAGTELSAVLFVLVATPLAALALTFHPPRFEATSERASALLAPVVLLISVVLAAIFYTSFAPSGDGFMADHHRHVFNDLPLHITLLSGFLANDVPSLNFTLFSGAEIPYHFLADYISAVLVRLGASIHLGIAVPTALLFLSFAVLFHGWCRRLGLTGGSALLAVSLIILSGTIVGLPDLVRDLERHGLAHRVFRFDYTYLDYLGNSLGNLIVNVLLPQRAFQLGAPAVILSLFLLHRNERIPTLCVALLLGMLPLAHMHSFLVLGLVVALSIFWSGARAREIAARGVQLLGIAGVLAAPQIIYLLQALPNDSALRLHLGWLIPREYNFFTYWLGVFPLLPVCILGVFLFPALRRQARVPLVIAVILFVVGNLIVTQKAAWDNVKFFFYVELFLLPFAASFFARWMGGGYMKVFVALSILLLQLVAGAQSIGTLFVRRELASQNDIAFAKRAARLIPPAAVSVIEPSSSHPLTMLAGRMVVLGGRLDRGTFPQWVWSYGFDYRERLADVRAIFQCAPDWRERMEKYEASYLVAKRDRAARLPCGGAGEMHLVGASYGWSIYRVPLSRQSEE